MILGELEFTCFRDAAGDAVSLEYVRDGKDSRTGAAVIGTRVSDEHVEKQGDRFALRERPEISVDARAYKMSKSRGNVVNPDDIVARYGADAFRLYEMFMGPLEQVKPWNTRGVEGTHRFLNRAWRLVAGSDEDAGSPGPAVDDAAPTREQARVLHQTIAKVTDDIEAMRFNTAISALMEFTNAATKWPNMPRATAEAFVLLLAPLAPHIAEELWQRLGHAESLAYGAWPVADRSFLKVEVLEIPVQVNGKMRGKITVSAEAPDNEVIEIAKADQNVGRHIAGRNVKRAIYVRGRIVNFVVGAG
jgi:leucyl-tRNA synthetase